MAILTRILGAFEYLIQHYNDGVIKGDDMGMGDVMDDGYEVGSLTPGDRYHLHQLDTGDLFTFDGREGVVWMVTDQVMAMNVSECIRNGKNLNQVLVVAVRSNESWDYDYDEGEEDEDDHQFPAGVALYEQCDTTIVFVGSTVVVPE